MKIAVAFLATALAVCAAPARADVTFQNGAPGWIYSLAVGETLRTPEVAVRFTTRTRDTVVLEVIGGCGKFGDATRFEVPVVAAGAGLVGLSPGFLATTPGACRIRASWENYIAELQVDVYDPGSLRVQPYDASFPVISVARGAASEIVKARVVDAVGAHAMGRRVRYAPDARRCALLSGASTPLESTSDASGIAPVDVSVPADAPVGMCTLTATLLENGRQVSLQVFVYDAALATLTSNPGTIATTAGGTMPVNITMRDGAGNPLPMVSLWGRDSTYIGGPGFAGGLEFFSSTSSLGTFVGTFDVNAIPGRYELSLLAGAREYRIPVVQSAPGQPSPPMPAVPAKSLQDMWWVGPAENGWGMSIVQHGDTLFSVIYAYADPTEDARWLVMPGGAWDQTHTRYTGPLYMPLGTPYHSYDTSKLVVQESVGLATLIFTDGDHATLDLTMPGNKLNARHGRKALTRQSFGWGFAPLSGLSDMWWGGTAQNGWGISVVQQAGVLFSVWFTYGDDRLATWYVMPTGTWTTVDTYEGRMYGTTNYSDWLGFYQPERLKVNDVGTFRFRFNPDATSTFDYTVGNNHGTLSLTRQPF